jgi:hypothetical protein
VGSVPVLKVGVIVKAGADELHTNDTAPTISSHARPQTRRSIRAAVDRAHFALLMAVSR